MTQEFEQAFEQWLRGSRYTDDAQTITKIGQRVHENLDRLGGIVAAASFERAYLELVSSGSIKAFKGTVTDLVAAETPAIPADIVAWIENPRVSSFEQRRRYSTDPTFKRYYDLYANLQLKAKVAAEENEESLTVELYNSMSAIDVARKYRASAAFKRGCDKLIKDGKI